MAIDHQFQAAKRSRADDVLQRFALSPPFDEFSKRVRLRLGQCALEIQVQLHAGHVQQMSEEQFDLQARRVHTLFGEKICAALDDFQDCHADNLRRESGVQSSKLAGEQPRVQAYSRDPDRACP